MRGNEYAELAAFVAVAEFRNFRAAARRFGVSPSALSHMMRNLEERLGIRLLNRTTRSVAPTDAGASLLATLAPAFSDISAAVEMSHAFRDRPSGTVRLNMPLMAAELIFTPSLGRFTKQHPEIRLEFAIDDGFTDIVAGGFDVGVRTGVHLQRDMVAVRCSPDFSWSVVGSPDYFAQHPPPRTPHDLQAHACINYRYSTGGGLFRWPFVQDGEAVQAAVEGPLVVNTFSMIVPAALQGVGLACTLEGHVADHLATGRLVRVLNDWEQEIPGFFLYYPSRRHLSPALRAVIDFFRHKD
jgi:DNA-binding transcriptional LysR family regulator